ncbi:hypothetical protein SPBR_08745 [Sporothrix brasiliensis 5110]|uniref:Uncharacterized protein n=1 Tax=Sporothrix brasiliensis 5110 TaxID=1398154 RepID=A0A0C2F7D9_9PEZI|nr:uncharacterized protein SPBR_08745 [Sporothrix brasiliensis 5110]KIH86988.1 hypothetical protein SPBR_08745 [Sporothrix brasiliensis 5110]
MDEECTEYELMVNNEKDKHFATDRVCDMEDQADRRATHLDLGDEVHDDVDLGTLATKQNHIRRSLAANASINPGHSGVSSLSIRFGNTVFAASACSRHVTITMSYLC